MAAILALGLHGRTLVLAEALLTCIISPCASAAPVVTQKLGGNLEEMTTYTFLSNFITALLIPICFPMLDEGADIGFITAFSLILYKVFTVLVIPMFLAYIVKHYMHGLCRRIVSVKDLSYYLWGCSLLIVSGTTMKNILHAVAVVPLADASVLRSMLVRVSDRKTQPSPSGLPALISHHSPP